MSWTRGGDAHACAKDTRAEIHMYHGHEAAIQFVSRTHDQRYNMYLFRNPETNEELTGQQKKNKMYFESDKGPWPRNETGGRGKHLYHGHTRQGRSRRRGVGPGMHTQIWAYWAQNHVYNKSTALVELFT